MGLQPDASSAWLHRQAVTRITNQGNPAAGLPNRWPQARQNRKQD